MDTSEHQTTARAGDRSARREQLSESKRALLAKRLRGRNQGRNAIQHLPADGPRPLSYTQQRVWFLQQLFPESTAYNMVETWRVRGLLRTDLLEIALSRVAERQWSLRTKFTAVDGSVAQVITTDAPSVLVTDLRALAPAARAAESVRLAEIEANYRFDLQAELPVRLALLQLDAEEYLLCLTIHHIVSDEWSMDLFWRDLQAAYSALLEQRDTALPPLPIQYTDYARWQRQSLAQDKAANDRLYWETQLTGLSGPVTLPADRPRPAVLSMRGDLIRRALPADLREGIQALCRDGEATPFMVLLAAFQVLLHRYSSADDIAVGTPIANRGRPETADVMGMFINTVVIRTALAGDPSFRTVLARVRQSALDALAHQEFPFDLLVQTLRPERDLSYNPLFQSMFVYLTDGEARTLPDVEMERIRVRRGVAKFDLTLLVGEADDHLVSMLEYSTDLFSDATAHRILAHWESLLHAIVARPDAPISTLALLDDDERRQLLAWGQGEDLALPVGQTLPQLIAAQAGRTPAADALIASTGTLTYAALMRRSTALARALLRRGVTAGTPVGLFVERSPEMLVGILGILQAGGAYVPLEPTYPPERIAYIVGDAATPHIVTVSDLVDRLPAHDGTALLLDELNADAYVDGDDDAQAAGPQSDLPVLSAADPAYIIYTSGSTGRPKGVVVTHANLMASTLARRSVYRRAVERYLLLSSFAFDSSVAGLFWTLVDGGTLVLPAPDEEKDVRRLAAIIARERVTHTLALPALYRLLLTYAPAGTLGGLQTVIVAGEACPPDLGSVHYDLLPNCSLYNEYGPTEATVWSTVYAVPPDAPAGPVPIGRPVPNYHIYLLDSQQQLVPVGVAGELHVAGPGVAQGYWGNPALTAARFVDLDLDGLSAPVRAYRTGDLARFRADGRIEFLGRIDDQVKIRGHRIEPGEIEATLLRHPSVDEAAVVVHVTVGPGAVENKQLIAYVAGPASTDSRALEQFAAESLPDALVPQQILRLDALPRTPNGKLDRAALPAPVTESQRTRPMVAPRTPAESTLARIWAELLGISAIGVHDKFFELGGDSLLSIRVIARAQQEGIHLTPRQLFKEQTIARIAAVAASGTDTASTTPLAPASVVGPAPLTPIQSWFFDQELTHPQHWNRALWFASDHALDPEALDRAIDSLIARHEALRLQFLRHGGRWQQEVVPDATASPIRMISFAEMTPAEQDAGLVTLADELHATMQLAPAPLLRSALVDLGPARGHRFLLVLHHLVVDTVSWGTLAGELETVYTQIVRGQPIQVGPTPVGYAEWSHTVSRLAAQGMFDEDARFWTGQRGPQTALPADRDGGENTEGRAAEISLRLDEERTGQLLRDAHHAYHTRVDDLLLTALVLALADWTGEPSAWVTLERHGREEVGGVDVSSTAGWFTALFPLALSVDDPTDPGAALRAVKEQLRALPRNGMSYGVLRYAGNDEVRAQLAAQPAPEILFNYLGQAPTASSEQGELWPMTAAIGQAYGSANRRAHLIDLNAMVVDGRLDVRIQYAADRFAAGTIAHFGRRYLSRLTLLLDHCVHAGDSRYTPSDFPMANLEQDQLDSLADLLDGLE